MTPRSPPILTIFTEKSTSLASSSAILSSLARISSFQVVCSCTRKRSCRIVKLMLPSQMRRMNELSSYFPVS